MNYRSHIILLISLTTGVALASENECRDTFVAPTNAAVLAKPFWYEVQKDDFRTQIFITSPGLSASSLPNQLRESILQADELVGLDSNPHSLSLEMKEVLNDYIKKHPSKGLTQRLSPAALLKLTDLIVKYNQSTHQSGVKKIVANFTRWNWQHSADLRPAMKTALMKALVDKLLPYNAFLIASEMKARIRYPQFFQHHFAYELAKMLRQQKPAIKISELPTIEAQLQIVKIMAHDFSVEALESYLVPGTDEYGWVQKYQDGDESIAAQIDSYFAFWNHAPGLEVLSNYLVGTILIPEITKRTTLNRIFFFSPNLFWGHTGIMQALRSQGYSIRRIEVKANEPQPTSNFSRQLQ